MTEILSLLKDYGPLAIPTVLVTWLKYRRIRYKSGEMEIEGPRKDVLALVRESRATHTDVQQVARTDVESIQQIGTDAGGGKVARSGLSRSWMSTIS